MCFVLSTQRPCWFGRFLAFSLVFLCPGVTGAYSQALELCMCVFMVPLWKWAWKVTHPSWSRLRPGRMLSGSLDMCESNLYCIVQLHDWASVYINQAWSCPVLFPLCYIQSLLCVLREVFKRLQVKREIHFCHFSLYHFHNESHSVLYFFSEFKNMYII